MTDESPPVTQDRCSSFRRWLIGTILIVAIAGGSLVGWAVAKGYTAEKQADAVNTRLKVHEGKQETHEEHLHKTLTRIEDMQERILDKIVNGN